jgi:hypothetical protein
LAEIFRKIAPTDTNRHRLDSRPSANIAHENRGFGHLNLPSAGTAILSQSFAQGSGLELWGVAFMAGRD